MSLNFIESTDKQNLKQRIKFTFPWIVTIPENVDKYGDGDSLDKDEFWMNYKFYSIKWNLRIRKSIIFLDAIRHYSEAGEPYQIWNGRCFISYKMYCDNDMEVELYSSERISTESETDADSFFTPEGALTEFSEAFEKGRVAKMKITFELELDVKYFIRPLELLFFRSNTKSCYDYPPDMMDDFRFEFLKESDFIIKCPDGSMPAMKMVLNITSESMNNHFMKSNDNELIVEHKLDVVKPVIIFLHSLCFEMPQSYDADFAKRLLAAIHFFELQFDQKIRLSIYSSIYRKFVEETPDFSSIIQWTSVATGNGLSWILDIIRSVIADKYYDELNKTFPENARNKNNSKFAELLDCKTYMFPTHEYRLKHFFDEIDREYEDSKQCSYVLL